MQPKVPPNDIQAEQALLGSILLRQDAILDVNQTITSQMFYVEKHSIIYEAMVALQSKREPIDLVSLTTELKSNNKLDEVGGTMYIVELLDNVPMSSNVTYYAKTVEERYTMRKLIKTGENIVEVGFSSGQTSSSAIELATSMILGIKNDKSSEDTDIGTIMSEFDETQEEFKKKQFGVSKLIGIPSGFGKIDGAIDGLRPGHFWAVSAYTSAGKCHSKDTNILMYDGSLKHVQDIIIGDKVMGVDSKPRNVLKLAHGYEDMYEIKPDRREAFTVNSGHILSLKRTGTTGDKINNRKDDIVNISVSEYLKSSKSFKHIHKLWSTGVEFKEKELPLNPYLFGYWLGNGTRNSTTISTNDSEIVEYLNIYCNDNKLKMSKYGKYDYSIVSDNNKNNNILLKSLRETGAYSDKHIPEIYKINSMENRLRLLAGLLDSDGYLDIPKNSFEFCSVKKQLADDVCFIARSCGLHAVVKTRSVATNFTNGKLCTSHRVFISGDVHIIPTIVTKKIAENKPMRTNPLRYGFSVTPVGYGEYFGFELDGDHLYFTENLIVQHNTSFLLNLINNLIVEHPVTFFSLEMSKADIISRLLGIETGVGMTKIMRHEFDTPEQVDTFTKARERLVNSKLKIYSKTNTLDGIILSMTRDMLRNNTKVFCIDYIQLVRTKSKSEYEQITEAAQRLQTFARETGCTIIVLSQVSNEHARDPNNEVHGTKGGGSLPASVDLAIELFNEDKKEDRDDKVHDGKPLSVKAIIKKNRHGRCGYVKLDFTPWNGQFKECTDWDI